MDEYHFLTDDLVKHLQVFPMTVYPGIFYSVPNDYIEALKMGNNNLNHFNSGDGFFFTERPVWESKEVRLNLARPMTLTVKGIFSEESQASTIWEILMGERLENKLALERLIDEIGLGEISDVWDQLSSSEGISLMKASGYDGIVSELTPTEKSFIVFESRQFQVLTKEAVIEAYTRRENPVINAEINRLKNESRRYPRIKF